MFQDILEELLPIVERHKVRCDEISKKYGTDETGLSLTDPMLPEQMEEWRESLSELQEFLGTLTRGCLQELVAVYYIGRDDAGESAKELIAYARELSPVHEETSALRRTLREKTPALAVYLPVGLEKLQKAGVHVGQLFA